ncbi:MAG: NTP transferase domain-containing protein [Candidatus Omnitrophica bacterium]|nr:NTP transferase domain-containing protein [Candidatus Omnitrophota bacterium]
MKDITAVILAAGKGTRMKSALSKVLHPVGCGTVLGEVVNSLERAGISDMIVVVGHQADDIKERFSGKGVRFVTQKELLGSGDALRSALEGAGGLRDRVLVTCGDTPVIKAGTYAALVRANGESGAACSVLTCDMDEPGSYGRIVRGADGKISGIVEEKDADESRKAIKEINVGSYCFNRGRLEKYINDIRMNPKKKEFYLTDIIEIFGRNGEEVVTAGCAPEEAIGVNTRRDLAEVNDIMNRRKLNALMDAGVTILDPGTTRVDRRVEIGADTVILPNTVIENNVTVGAGCRIGPFTRLRPGTTLAENVEVGNFVELCRTSVGKGTLIKHHTYLGDTTVGENVNIGAGTITANYDGRDKHGTVIDDGVFIGVGAVLIAPLRIGTKAKIGAGSVVTRNKDVPAGQTVIGIPARPFQPGAGAKEQK